MVNSIAHVTIADGATYVTIADGGVIGVQTVHIEVIDNIDPLVGPAWPLINNVTDRSIYFASRLEENCNGANVFTPWPC